MHIPEYVPVVAAIVICSGFAAWQFRKLIVSVEQHIIERMKLETAIIRFRAERLHTRVEDSVKSKIDESIARVGDHVLKTENNVISHLKDHADHLKTTTDKLHAEATRLHDESLAAAQATGERAVPSRIPRS